MPVRPCAYSISTESHRVCVQMGGLSLSLGPIHLYFLASPLCPIPFFQLPIHLPLATHQPSIVPRCSWVDLGREVLASQVSHTDGEEQSLGKSSSWCISAPVHQSSTDVGLGQLRCRLFPMGHARAHSATCGGGSGDSQSPSTSLLLVNRCG